jgi:hypothetical protein
MSKQIYVQAQSDHIESMFGASPLSALEELVWNALDAGAREVKVDLITNPLGAVEAVRIVDDGTGIDVLKIDSTFGSLGGSWKRFAQDDEPNRRRLHGRHGRGLFKAFSLGCHVEWRTTMRVGNELMSYCISGEAHYMYSKKPFSDWISPEDDTVPCGKVPKCAEWEGRMIFVGFKPLGGYAGFLTYRAARQEADGTLSFETI